MKFKDYINEVKVKGGHNPAILVIGYKEAKKLGIADDVEKIYLLNTPLPMKEREVNVEEWKKKDSKLVLDTQILDPKNKKKVEKMLIKRYGKP